MKEFYYRAADPKNQDALDRANKAYIKVAPEHNLGKPASADDIYEALLCAWEFICDTTTQVEV